MDAELHKRISRVLRLKYGILRTIYFDVFGHKSFSNGHSYLRNRIVWGLQAQSEGGLSERARRRAEYLLYEEKLLNKPKADRRKKLEPTNFLDY